MKIPLGVFPPHKTIKNFGICVGQIQKKAMPQFTDSLHAGQSFLTENIAEVSNQVHSIRKLQSKLRPALGGNFLNMFNVFGKVVSAFHQFINGFKDLLMRILAVMATTLYILQGQQMVGESIVKGPMMGAMKVLSFGQIQ